MYNIFHNNCLIVASL